jgi:serine protease Do
MKHASLWTLLLAAALYMGAAATAGEIDAARAVERAIERAAEKVSPAVVNIVVTREPGGGDTEHLEGLPDELREFFDRMRPDPGGPFRWQGNGSGVLISSDGVILTSEHVVRDASEIEVTLADRRRFPAKVVGADPRRDLAVIRVDAGDLPSARLGDADRLRRGQFVLALGSPFGFGRDGQASLSFGIVSGTGRAIPGIGAELDRYYGNLIQTDAAVNPGNSGGPLVDLDGRIVGVNAVISSQTGVSEGVGFAVPITQATRRIIERLRRGEEIVYGFIGIEITEVGQETAQETGAEVGQGAFVVRALPDGPGAKAGLKQGDVVLAVNGRPVRGPDDVIQMVQVTPVGESVALTVLRDGKRREVKVEVTRRPPPGEMLARRFRVTPQWRGMKVEPLTDELREQIGLEEKAEGVFVREVRDDSPAAKAGIAPGMVIDQVGETKVASVRTFQNAIRTQEGKCMVHVVGIGVKVIPAPEDEAETEEE